MPKSSFLVASLTFVLASLTGSVWSRPANADPVPGQVDTFDNGNLMEWQQGVVYNVTGQADGGPLGAGDGWIQVTSTGILGPGCRLSVFNLASRWIGNWAAARIGALTVDLKNDSAMDLYIRFKLEGITATVFEHVYTEARAVPADGQWASYTFEISPTALSGTGEPAEVLTNIFRFRIEHNPTGTHPPPEIQATLGIDNVATVEATTICGNGVLDGFEICDGSELGGQTCADLPLFDDGPLACDPSCYALDESACTDCGDGVCAGNETETSCPFDCITESCGDGLITGAEVCEPNDLQGQTCLTQGFDWGVLACAADCQSLDTAACHNETDDGCGCQASGGEAACAVVLLFLLVLPWVRRRAG